MRQRSIFVRYRRAFLGLLLVISCAAFGLSLLSEDTKRLLHTTGRLHPWFHFALFFVLGALTILASSNTRTRIFLIAGAALLGLSIECTESFRFQIPFEVYDVVTDTCGIVFGALLSYLIVRKMR